MFLHADFHLLVLEFYIHTKKIVLVSSHLRHLPKSFFINFDCLINHLWVHTTDIVIIHVPVHYALFPLEVCVCYAQIVWDQFKTHVLQGVQI